MGPITLFDKSFLQSLSADEAVWFDHFSLPVVCPIFYVETLADLAKEPGKRSVEEIVADISRKFPEWSGAPCGFHIDMCVNNLSRRQGRYGWARAAARRAEVKKGIVYETTPEEEAFQRWNKGEFLDVERVAAARWRRTLSELDLKKVASELEMLGIEKKHCRTLEEARDRAREIVNGKERPNGAVRARRAPVPYSTGSASTAGRAVAQYGRADLRGVRAVRRLRDDGRGVLSRRHGVEPDRHRAGLEPDGIAYLFYLPFCMVFASSDDLHRRCAKLFLRDDREFVWGIDLKQALKTVNTHFLELPEEERDKGITRFAHSPPDGNLMADLWDRHLRKDYRKAEPVKTNPEKDAEILARFKGFRDQPTIDTPQEPDDHEIISIPHAVRHNRGSWWQLAKDFKRETTG